MDFTPQYYKYVLAVVRVALAVEQDLGFLK